MDGGSAVGYGSPSWPCWSLISTSVLTRVFVQPRGEPSREVMQQEEDSPAKNDQLPAVGLARLA